MILVAAPMVIGFVTALVARICVPDEWPWWKSLLVSCLPGVVIVTICHYTAALVAKGVVHP